MKYVVLINASKEIIASVKIVNLTPNLTPIVPAVSHVVIGHAQVAQIASVSPVPATATVKYQRIVVEELVQKVTATRNG